MAGRHYAVVHGNRLSNIFSISSTFLDSSEQPLGKQTPRRRRGRQEEGQEEAEVGDHMTLGKTSRKYTLEGCGMDRKEGIGRKRP